MTKKLPLVLSTFLFALSTQAAVITPEQALERYNGLASTRSSVRDVSALHLSFTFQSAEGVPTLYVFNEADDSGFVILGADDTAFPLLGYSDKSGFDVRNISPSLRWWLNEYGRQIEYGRMHSVSSGMGVSTRAAQAAIAPMIKTTWNQGKPYNNDCPRVNDIRCVTGCVATAMAQVMNYYKYPEKGTGVVSISLAGTDDPTELDLSLQSFDWANMRDSYQDEDYTDSQAAAVAYLMKACGYSVGMSYSSTESGAPAVNLGSALIENFGYNPEISYEERDYYSSAAWEEMVYDELKAGRPVLYSGMSEGGGHQFVCDGYDNGYFHINWGWGGLSDGYFLLQSLNPADLGVGGGTGGGFSFYQSIIKGVQPQKQSTTAPVMLYQGGNLAGNKSSTAKIGLRCQGGTGGWWNMGYKEIEVSFGVIIESIDQTPATKTEVVGTFNDQSLEKVKLGSMRGYNSFSFLFPTNLPDGKYRATVAFKDLKSSTSQWTPVASTESCSNSVVIVKNGSKYTVEFSPAKTLSITTADILSELYYGSYAKVRIEVTNPHDIELTQTIAPTLMKQGDNWFVAGGIPVSLKPGESVTKEIVTYFSPQEVAKPISAPTDFSLKIINLENGETYKFSKSVTMNPESDYSISCVKVEMPGATESEYEGVRSFVVNDPSKMEINAEITCDGGFFAHPVYAFIFPYEGGMSLTSAYMSPQLLLADGETGRISGVLYFEGGVEGGVYAIWLYAQTPSGFKAISDSNSVLDLRKTGVEEIVAQNSVTIVYDSGIKHATAYSSHGIRSVSVNSIDGTNASDKATIDGCKATIDFSTLSKGIWIVKVVNSEGVAQSKKLIL